MQSLSRSRRVAQRIGVVVLGVVAIAAAGPVAIASAATPTSITISTSTPQVPAGTPVTYTALDQDKVDVTADTTFAITPDGSCNANVCTPARPGQHTVTATNGTAKAMATLRVPTQLPVGKPDTYTATAGTPLTVAAPGVLGNDTDADGDALTAKLVDPTDNGTLDLKSDGSFTYTAKAGFEGNDRFTYRPNDGRTNGDGNTTTVTITVGAAPTEAFAISPQTAQGTIGVGQPYTATAGTTDVTTQTTFSIVGGTCTANVCTPTSPGSHQVTGRYNGARDDATLTVGNRTPAAKDDTYSVDSDTVLTVPAPGVLANDSDPDPGTTLTAFPSRQPTHGVLVLSADGGFVYTPAPGYVGPDSFAYRARDGQPQGSSEATVSITVTQANRAPTAVADSYSTPFQKALTVTAPGVLGNDTDPDAGTTLTARQVTGPANGTLALNANGSFTYTPAAGFSGPDAFTYVANDGSLSSLPTTVTLTVAGPTGPARADVSVTLAGKPGAAGTPFPITVTTRNDGPFAAQNVLTTVVLPPGARATSAPGGAVSRDGRTVVYYAPSLAAARSNVATITVTLDPKSRGIQIAAGGVISRTIDPQLRNNGTLLTIRR